MLNGRDSAAQLLSEVIPGGVNVLTYGVPSRGEAWAPLDLAAHSLQVSFEGTRFELEPRARFPELPASLRIRAVGEIFVENALAALAAALASGVPARAAASALGARGAATGSLSSRPRASLGGGRLRAYAGRAEPHAGDRAHPCVRDGCASCSALADNAIAANVRCWARPRAAPTA